MVGSADTSGVRFREKEVRQCGGSTTSLPGGAAPRATTGISVFTKLLLANSGLLACENGQVRFRWKDYRAGNKSKVMTLNTDEFIRRFLLHVLPTGFRRIRHFGFLANACRAAKFPAIRATASGRGIPKAGRAKEKAGSAARGELRLPLLAGLAYDLGGAITLNPDEEVQARLRLVFAKFRGLQSARAVMRFLRANALPLPMRPLLGPSPHEVIWQEPDSARVHKEVQALLDAPDPTTRDDFRDQAMLHLPDCAGLRISELRCSPTAHSCQSGQDDPGTI